jgi:outer membrane protein TolC
MSGTAGWTNSIGGAIVNPGEFIGSALLSILQPIFNKGALVANLKIMKANQEIAYLNFQQSILKAGSEVNLALDKYQTAKAKSEFYAKQVSTLEVAANSTKLLMKYGNTTYLEVLTAQTTLLNAQLNQVSNKFVEIQSMIELYRALGGGQD